MYLTVCVEGMSSAINMMLLVNMGNAWKIQLHVCIYAYLACYNLFVLYSNITCTLYGLWIKEFCQTFIYESQKLSIVGLNFALSSHYGD